MVEVQVKTANSTGSRTNWPLGAQKVSVSDREWFVLVLLPQDPLVPPRAFVVPRDHVAAGTFISHQNWLTQPGVPEGKRNAPWRQSRVELSVWLGCENQWDLLLKPTSEAPVLLPSNYRSLALEERVGLPPGHPWAANEDAPTSLFFDDDARRNGAYNIDIYMPLLDSAISRDVLGAAGLDDLEVIRQPMGANPSWITKDQLAPHHAAAPRLAGLGPRSRARPAGLGRPQGSHHHVERRLVRQRRAQQEGGRRPRRR
jgi:hypothetical protein